MLAGEQHFDDEDGSGSGPAHEWYGAPAEPLARNLRSRPRRGAGRPSSFDEPTGSDSARPVGRRSARLSPHVIVTQRPNSRGNGTQVPATRHVRGSSAPRPRVRRTPSRSVGSAHDVFEAHGAEARPTVAAVARDVGPGRPDGDRGPVRAVAVASAAGPGECGQHLHGVAERSSDTTAGVPALEHQREHPTAGRIARRDTVRRWPSAPASWSHQACRPPRRTAHSPEASSTASIVGPVQGGPAHSSRRPAPTE